MGHSAFLRPWAARQISKAHGCKGWHQRCLSSTTTCGSSCIHRRETERASRRLGKAVYSGAAKARWSHSWLRLVVRGTKYFQFGIAAQALKSCSYIVASVFSAHATSRTHFTLLGKTGGLWKWSFYQVAWCREGHMVGLDCKMLKHRSCGEVFVCVCFCLCACDRSILRPICSWLWRHQCNRMYKVWVAWAV